MENGGESREAGVRTGQKQGREGGDRKLTLREKEFRTPWTRERHTCR